MTTKTLSVALAALFILSIGCDQHGKEVFGVRQFTHNASGEPTLVPLKASAVASVVEVVVGKDGGRVVDPYSFHDLKIMKGAVSEPTRFIMTTFASTYAVVDLRAYRIRDGAPVTQFPDDLVKLRLSFRNATVQQVKDLKVVYLVDGTLTGRKELLQTKVDETSMTIQAKLTHFSHYTMAF